MRLRQQTRRLPLHPLLRDKNLQSVLILQEGSSREVLLDENGNPA